MLRIASAPKRIGVRWAPQNAVIEESNSKYKYLIQEDDEKIELISENNSIFIPLDDYQEIATVIGSNYEKTITGFELMSDYDEMDPISFSTSYIGNEVYIESAVRNISDNPQGYLDGQSWNWKGNYALELVGGWYVFISAKDYGSVINSLNIGDYVRVTGVINGISDYSDKGIVLLSTKTVSPSVEKLN